MRVQRHFSSGMHSFSTPLAVRAATITPIDKSTAITIASWVTLAVLIVFFILRLILKYTVLRKFQLDDLLILLATIFAIGLSATTLILASEGLGILGRLTIHRANVIMKGSYASDFLYIASICFAKLSIVAWFYGIGVHSAQRRVQQVLGIFIIAWMVGSLAAVAFQCGLPKPWEKLTLHCYNGGVFWIVYCIIDMTTEVSIIMLSVNLVLYLKVKLSTKIAIVACFAPRLFVIAASLIRLIYLFPITPHMRPDFHLWIPVICTQIQVCLSISTACIPYMKPVFSRMESGMWRVNDLRRKSRSTVQNLNMLTYESGYSPIKRKEQDVESVNSNTGLRYGRTPDVSPRLPGLEPLSPLLPAMITRIPSPRENSRASSMRSPSERGLMITIPKSEQRAVIDAASPQTASSHVLSPGFLSPQPLLSPPLLSPTYRQPTPPLRSYSPQPLMLSMSSISPEHKGLKSPPMPTAANTGAPTPGYPRTPPTQYSPFPQTFKIPPPSATLRRASMQRPPNMSQSRAATRFPVRTSSVPTNSTAKPKFSTSPNPTTSPTSTISSFNYAKTPPMPSSTELPPAIPSYYFKTPPSSNPPTFPVPDPPTSPQQARRQRILRPQNSSRRDQMANTSPVSPTSPRTPLTFWRDESSGGESAGASAGTTWNKQESERHWPPVFRDVRSSPRIIVHEAS
ncbi:hypothetical protein P154DRAFT_523993 [Amniculicola lignicola CBS 123094]|uniref:Rhodopsin domain-containing protein n=1 Tax=Amniculicola lignicola CBS 123094 TaxID=1392246 RepID=A0A6A5WAT1_9PLEO|nr:hypothetical protein P154DRAFT_523993 [Amniculicola lignicola CBS 123094]